MAICTTHQIHLIFFPTAEKDYMYLWTKLVGSLFGMVTKETRNLAKEAAKELLGEGQTA